MPYACGSLADILVDVVVADAVSEKLVELRVGFEEAGDADRVHRDDRAVPGRECVEGNLDVDSCDLVHAPDRCCDIELHQHLVGHVGKAVVFLVGVEEWGIDKSSHTGDCLKAIIAVLAFLLFGVENVPGAVAEWIGAVGFELIRTDETGLREGSVVARRRVGVGVAGVEFPEGGGDAEEIEAGVAEGVAVGDVGELSCVAGEVGGVVGVGVEVDRSCVVHD